MVVAHVYCSRHSGPVILCSLYFLVSHVQSSILVGLKRVYYLVDGIVMLWYA